MVTLADIKQLRGSPIQDCPAALQRATYLLGDGDGAAEALADAFGLEEADAEADALADAFGLADAEADGLADGAALDGAALGEGEGTAETVGDGLGDGETLPVGVQPVSSVRASTARRTMTENFFMRWTPLHLECSDESG